MAPNLIASTGDAGRFAWEEFFKGKIRDRAIAVLIYTTARAGAVPKLAFRNQSTMGSD